MGSFCASPVICVRINTLKAKREDVLGELLALKISFEQVSWYPDALILRGLAPKQCAELDVISKARVYRQGLSSMLPALVLNPQPGEKVLDFCAAPGSKTTQMAALMKNEGELVAVEAIVSRFHKLKSVCELLGAANVSFKLTDARRFRSGELFDKVLVDAPCSSEGRFKINDPKSLGYWSLRKIKEMSHKQKGLLLSASRFLKPGGVLVYSTCTFAPEENEGVVDWVMRKADGPLKLAPVIVDGLKSCPVLKRWGKKDFVPGIENCLRVLPCGPMEGFFVAKFVKQ